MRVIIFVGFIVFFRSFTASAASLEPLLRAAGLSVMSTPTPAVDFQLPDVAGRVYRLRDQRGKVVFLNFWATWCPPCLHEMPLMEAIHQSLRQRPFVMWAVDMQERQEEVTLFMQDQGFHFLALLDSDGRVSANYVVLGLPTTYLIDCTGMVVGKAVGPRQWDNDATRTLLAALLSAADCD